MKQTVFVGMSGGVDSSVTAALLKERGYNVIGVYMKNWTRDFPGVPCTWKEDYQDAKRVAVQLGIDFRVYDFEKEYRQKVVDYMVTEYQAGRTPNPDIMCNQEVKFKLFLNTALEDGADLIATGHYAQIKKQALRNNKQAELHTAMNTDKDQTYFLYRVTEEALQRCLMPIGEFKTKDEVRTTAKKFGLATADKKDSQGICFVGKVGIKDFLLAELGPQPPGAIIDDKGRVIGEHDGAIFYTIGQRHGLDVGGGLPYYVVGKDMKKNEVYVTTNLDNDKLWHETLTLINMHWINGGPLMAASSQQPAESNGKHPANMMESIMVRTRYRAPLIKVESLEKSGSKWEIKLADPVRAVTPGQSAVLYSGDRVLGGGILV